MWSGDFGPACGGVVVVREWELRFGWGRDEELEEIGIGNGNGNGVVHMTPTMCYNLHTGVFQLIIPYINSPPLERYIASEQADRQTDI